MARMNISGTAGDSYKLPLEECEDLESAVFLAISNAAFIQGQSGLDVYDRERINSYAGQLTRYIRNRMIEVPYQPPKQEPEGMPYDQY